MTIKLPDSVLYILTALETAGHSAYAVGGCVRDSLLGRAPEDWDICTDALPAQTMSLFPGQTILPTGLRHGTVTLMRNHKPFEITTYRMDGPYSDNRRPDTVAFVRDLGADLSRRDFTINALAYNPKTGVVDLFDGLGDLQAGVIRCVGDPDRRFQEDALRIMRGLRFAAVYGFSIAPDTAKAMADNKGLLQHIAAERIAAELNKLLVGKGGRAVLSAHLPILVEIIPEFAPAVGFEQNNPYHCYDVMTHILYAVHAAPPDLLVRLALLFHDIGKPSCYTRAEDGVGHFYGHAKVSAALAKDILTRLKADNKTVKTVTELVAHHDSPMTEPIQLKRGLNRMGEDRLRRLLAVKRADALAQAEAVRAPRQEELDRTAALLDEIMAQRQCFSLKDLAVNGRDLMAIGYPQGEALGRDLNRLMELVINEEAENDKAALLVIAREMRAGGINR